MHHALLHELAALRTGSFPLYLFLAGGGWCAVTLRHGTAVGFLARSPHARLHAFVRACNCPRVDGGPSGFAFLHGGMATGIHLFLHLGAARFHLGPHGSLACFGSLLALCCFSLLLLSRGFGSGLLLPGRPGRLFRCCCRAFFGAFCHPGLALFDTLFHLGLAVLCCLLAFRSRLRCLVALFHALCHLGLALFHLFLYLGATCFDLLFFGFCSRCGGSLLRSSSCLALLHALFDFSLPGFHLLLHFGASRCHGLLCLGTALFRHRFLCGR